MALILGALRFWQAQDGFDHQRALFPRPTSGFFKVWVCGAPEVLFDREPGSREDGQQDGFYSPQVNEVRAVCQLISLNGKPEPPVKARIVFKLSGDHAQALLNEGETVEFEGKLEPPEPAQNPGQFDYSQFLKNQGVAYAATIWPGSWRALPREPSRGFFLAHWAASLSRAAQTRIDRLWPYPESALMSGILLGDRVGIPQDIVEDFIVTGTVHILAVSGLITAFVAGILFLFLRAAQIPRKGAAVLTLLGLVFFVLMTGAHPPVFRAGVFSGLALLALLFERRVSGGNLLLVTAFILVMVNPFVLTDLSFQISFLATAGLMVMASGLMKRLSLLGEPLSLIAAATLAAQLSVWVLLLTVFNLFAVYSVPANLVVVPLVLFSTAGGLTALGISCLWPFGGKLLAAGVFGALHLLMLLAAWMRNWPFAEWIVGTPPTTWTLLFHAGLLATFFAYWPRPRPEKPSEKWKKRHLVYQRLRRMVLVGDVLFLLLSVVLVTMNHFAGPPSLRVTFLAVGHGNAVVVRSPQGKVLVVDGGKETRGPDRYLPLVAYLRFLGVHKVAAALDTHPDEDHVGGLVNLVSAYPVARVYEGVGAQASTDIYRAFHTELKFKGDPLYFLKNGDQLNEVEPAQALILHPPVRFEPSENADNNRSVVTWINYPAKGPDFSVLLPGDLEKAGLLKLLADHQPFPRVDWLMAPHHGRLSGEPALCARGLKPRFVVFSDAVDYPQCRALYEKNDPGVTVLSTAVDGAIELEIFQDGHARYRTFRHPQWVLMSPVKI
ncbi:MAG: ComEC/Rec2 family competence protein [bacterium]